jgi:hypothetical protein
MKTNEQTGIDLLIQKLSLAGIDLLIEKLSREGVNGIVPLLPDARYGQDVAMVAFVIDDLRTRVAKAEREVGRLRARFLS